MSPNARERAYERRRYEEWQAKLTERKVRRRRARRMSASIAGGVLVVAIIVGTFWAVSRNGSKDSSTTAASATPSVSASASAATNTNKACPVPTVKAPASPKKFSKAPSPSVAQGKSWTLTLDTTCGKVALDLDGAKAPQAVSVMITLARAGFFNGSPCHRLTTAGIYVLQCGDPTGTGTGGPGYSYGPIENAPKDNVYPAGTVAMARGSGDAKSNGSQFFLVYKDSTIPSDTAGGYSVIGTVSSGLDVVNKVASGASDNANGTGDGAPKEKISIASTTVTAGHG